MEMLRPADGFCYILLYPSGDVSAITGWFDVVG